MDPVWVEEIATDIIHAINFKGVTTKQYETNDYDADVWSKLSYREGQESWQLHQDAAISKMGFEFKSTVRSDPFQFDYTEHDRLSLPGFDNLVGQREQILATYLLPVIFAGDYLDLPVEILQIPPTSQQPDILTVIRYIRSIGFEYYYDEEVWVRDNAGRGCQRDEKPWVECLNTTLDDLPEANNIMDIRSIKYMNAVNLIQSAFRKAKDDPQYKMCYERLIKEFWELGGVEFEGVEGRSWLSYIDEQKAEEGRKHMEEWCLQQLQPSKKKLKTSVGVAGYAF